MFNKLLEKLGHLSYKTRYLMTGIFLILFISVTILQVNINISYSMQEDNKINEVFSYRDSLVILYENSEENNIASLVSSIETKNAVTSVSSYSTSLNKELTNTELAYSMKIDESLINVFYYIYTNGYQTNDMTITTFINYIQNNILNNNTFEEYFDETIINTLNTYGTMINQIADNYEFTSAEISSLTQMDQDNVEQLFYMASQELGTEITKMTLPSFINMIFLNDDISENLTDLQKQNLSSMSTLCNLVTTNTALASEELSQLLPINSPNFNTSTIKLLYLYYNSNLVDLSQIKIGMDDFLNFLIDDISTNDSFETLFNEDMLTSLVFAKEQLNSGKEQLIGDNYSRIIVNINYGSESEEMNSFYTWLRTKLDKSLDNYYLIGNSAMSYEMSQSFQHNFYFISIITAIAIFIIIAIVFRKLSIPLILILLIQTSIYITMTVMIINNVSMYYIALLIVQGLLMGATIDYAILFTTYYREARKKHPIQIALGETYKKSIHTILTSALIMILVTGILSFSVSSDIAQILTTISIGASSATILVLFFLPSIIATFDKYIIEKEKNNCNSYTNE